MIFLWLLFPFGSALVANSKGANVFLWFLMGIIFGPLGLLFAFFSGGKKCPSCKSKIHKNAIKCPKCQTEIIDENKEKLTE